MSGIDVRDLAKEELQESQFPANSKADFRLFMDPEVHRGTCAHAKKDMSVEICGVLVGVWKQDDDGPYAVVTNFIPCETAASKFAEVTFTHDAWAHINREMDTRFADERIIGWYHSHPDFGIFLSDRDCFIQEHFFSSPGQIAYVIDPVRSLEGVFAWRAGKPTPLEHYWIGDSIRTFDASYSAASHKLDRGRNELAGESPANATPSRRPSSFDLATTILSWLALFLLGYLVAGRQTRWERDMIVEGTVAHYGYNKLMKIGLEGNLERVRAQLSAIATALDHLPESTAELSVDERETVAKQRALIANNLSVCERMLGDIQAMYGLSNEERMILLQIIAQKQAELRGLSESAEAPAPKSRVAPTDVKDAGEKNTPPLAATDDADASTDTGTTNTTPR